MKTLRISWIAGMAIGLLAIGASSARADDCVRLGGVINAGECQVSAAVTRSDLTAPGGPYAIAETLRITSTGKITIPQGAANSLTINITGQFIMEDGAQIIGDNGGLPNNSQAIGATITINATGDIVLGGDNGNGGALISSKQLAGSCGTLGRGGNISLVSTGGNVTADEGSVVTTSSAVCPAGDIAVTALPTGKIDWDGSALAQGLISGTGTRAGGGRITFKAGCDLTISDTGVLSSQGKDQGADLVHLEACVVTVHGLVESVNVQGGGHADSVVNDNACNTNLAAHPQFPPLDGNPLHPVIFTGCVEIWSGTTVTIDSTGGNNGEVSVDGVVANSSWIDVFANGDINLIGDTVAPYVLHGNPTGATNNTAALITVKSKTGNVSASNLAIQADATGGGSRGGSIRIEAGGALLLNTAQVSAQGDFVSTGGFGFGGKITTRSFAGSQTWQNGVADVEPTGLGIAVANRGVVTFQVCDTGAEDHTGTSFPVTSGAQSNPVIDNTVGACGGMPNIPVTLPPPNCTELCRETPPPGDCEKASVRSVLNPLTGRFPGNNGPDATVRLDLGDTVQDAVDNATNNNGDPYLIILVVKDGTGKLGGSTSENVVISKDYSPDRFALVACSVTIKAEDAGLPAGHVEQSAASVAGSPENIFVMDLHGANSGVAGWLVEGNGRYFRNVANKNNATGIAFLGTGHTMHNGNAEGNSGVGIYVQGTGNLVDSADSNDNGGHGIQVLGDGNILDGTDVGDRGKGNSGDGINVDGDGNQILENDVFANLGNGIFVVGDSSTIKKNDVGERGKENGLDGIHVEGSNGNLQENNAKANGLLGGVATGGDGFDIFGTGNFLKKNAAGDSGDNRNTGDGFHVLGNNNVFEENKANVNLGDGFDFAGTGNSLKKTSSNESAQNGSKENVGLEYRFASPVLDLTGNKKDNANFVGVGAPKTYAAGNYE